MEGVGARRALGQCCASVCESAHAVPVSVTLCVCVSVPGSVCTQEHTRVSVHSSVCTHRCTQVSVCMALCVHTCQCAWLCVHTDAEEHTCVSVHCCMLCGFWCAQM